MTSIKRNRKLKWGFYIPFEECDRCSMRETCKKLKDDNLEYLTKRRKAIAEYIKLFFPIYIFPSPIDMYKELGVQLSAITSIDGGRSVRNNIFIVDSYRSQGIEFTEIMPGIEEEMYKELQSDGKISLILNLRE